MNKAQKKYLFLFILTLFMALLFIWQMKSPLEETMLKERDRLEQMEADRNAENRKAVISALNIHLKNHFHKEVTVYDFDNDLLQYKDYIFFHDFDGDASLILPSEAEPLRLSDNFKTILIKDQGVLLYTVDSLGLNNWNEKLKLYVTIMQSMLNFEAHQMLHIEKGDDFIQAEGLFPRDTKNNEVFFCLKVVNRNWDDDKLIFFFCYDPENNQFIKQVMDSSINPFPDLPN